MESFWALLTIINNCFGTVDGFEILRSPVDVVDIPVFIRVHYTSQVLVSDF